MKTKYTITIKDNDTGEERVCKGNNILVKTMTNMPNEDIYVGDTFTFGMYDTLTRGLVALNVELHENFFKPYSDEHKEKITKFYKEVNDEN